MRGATPAVACVRMASADAPLRPEARCAVFDSPGWLRGTGRRSDPATGAARVSRRSQARADHDIHGHVSATSDSPRRWSGWLLCLVAAIVLGVLALGGTLLYLKLHESQLVFRVAASHAHMTD